MAPPPPASTCFRARGPDNLARRSILMSRSSRATGLTAETGRTTRLNLFRKGRPFHWYHNISVILVLPAGHVAAEEAAVPLKNGRKRGVGGAVLPAVPSLENAP
jgi:hypothetical protein